MANMDYKTRAMREERALQNRRLTKESPRTGIYLSDHEAAEKYGFIAADWLLAQKYGQYPDREKRAFDGYAFSDIRNMKKLVDDSTQRRIYESVKRKTVLIYLTL